MEKLTSERVAILGASSKPERYGHKAMTMLQQHGHTPVLISPKEDCINGLKVFKEIKDVENIDTLTMYVNPTISSSLIEDIIALKPKRVIFNPGTENKEHYNRLIESGIEIEEACTLVLLSTGQF